MEYTKYDIGAKELAYIAGFFDGEGCIMIHSHGNLQIHVTNTDVAPLQFIMDVFGGGIYKASSASETRKKVYRWSVGGINAQEVLEMLLPYLICKKQQATLAIEFGSAEHARKLDIAVQIKVLKH